MGKMTMKSDRGTRERVEAVGGAGDPGVRGAALRGDVRPGVGQSGRVARTGARARVVLLAGLLLLVMPVTMAQGRTQVYYVHNDHLGTPQMLTDQAGRKVWEIASRPFGEAVVDEDPDEDGISVECNLRFPGQYYDAESGLHYNYHRDYDPKTGRYLQGDPIGIKQGTNHLYVYASNNPVSLTDPEGLDSPGCTIPEWLWKYPVTHQCYLNCCAIHDKCYRDNDCSCSSWGRTLFGGPLWRLSSCVRCNDAVSACFARCRLRYPVDAPGRYYCGKHNIWFNDPSNPHMNCSTN